MREAGCCWWYDEAWRTLTTVKLIKIPPPEELDREIQDIAYDSRKVKSGSLFVAMRGYHLDGHQYISQAVRCGAVGIIAEDGRSVVGTGTIPVAYVLDSRAALATIAPVFFGWPSDKLKLIGITGTKGKTTTSYLIKSIIEATGHTTGLIGTIDYRVGNKIYPALNTTPESLDIQKLLREMVDASATYCVMEVSSHALALGRTRGCRFESAIFTNLQQDHLDFHKNKESYFQAKLLLFTELASGKYSVVNADDDASKEIVRRITSKVYTFGMSAQADIRPTGKIVHSISGARLFRTDSERNCRSNITTCGTLQHL